MFNHAPDGYRCPFCLVVGGGEDDLTRQEDIVLRTERAMAFVASRWWPNNRGHMLVVPTEHHENVYDLPAGYQDAWHYHVHVFPRYEGDNLYNTRHLTEPATAEEREPYALRLREYFAGRSE